MSNSQAGDLNRFVIAQDQDNLFEVALDELRSGEKQSHWMWFIFPQHLSLCRSQTAKHFGIVNHHEAIQYREHSVLGTRLNQATEAVLSLQDRSAEQIFGRVDAMKFHASMTLFDHVHPDQAAPPARALQKHFKHQVHEDTVAALVAEGCDRRAIQS